MACSGGAGMAVTPTHNMQKIHEDGASGMGECPHLFERMQTLWGLHPLSLPPSVPFYVPAQPTLPAHTPMVDSLEVSVVPAHFYIAQIV